MGNGLQFETNANGAQRARMNALAGTPLLVNCSEQVVSEIMTIIQDNADKYNALFEASKTDHVAMETLINEAYDLSTVDASFLKQLSEAELTSMLKSQQSKRSRAKSKAMTVDNYMNMMNAAISELLLRDALDKPRASGGFRNGKSILEYTPEEIQALGEDQEALRRAIRNVQSQKCLMKQHDDFDEASEKYQSLLKLEAVLKDLRIVFPRQRTDKTRQMIKDALAAHDVEHLKAADSKELLKMIAAMVADEEESVDTTSDEDAVEVNNEEVAEDVE